MKNLHAILVILIFFIGCTQQVACNKPYIKVGSTCCLDLNDNAICDSDEKTLEKETKTTDNITGKETKSVSEGETEIITQKEIDRIVADVTEKEIERITKERTKEITDGLIANSTLVKEVYCDIPTTKRQFSNGPYYTGPLIDTHVHMPVASKAVSETAIQLGFEDMPYRGDISTDYIICLFESEGITRTFGFFINHKLVLQSSVNALKDDKKKHSEKIVAFFMPPFPVEGQAPEASEVEKVLKNNPDLYQGYGELRFDFTGIENSLPDDDYLLEMYELADKYNLIVQIHPDKGQVDKLEDLLKKYPKVKFLAHVMPTERDEVARLMDKYDNLYYSLDAEINSLFGYKTIQNNKGPTKKEYMDFMKENFNSLLEEKLKEWKPRIEAHPDRYTWGSDRWYTWHYDQDVGAIIEEFGRSFIGKLDPAVQEKFAYKNAEELLKNR